MEYRTVVRPRLVVSCPYVYGVAESAVRPVSAADCPPPFPRWNRVAYAQGRAVTLFLPPPSNHAQKHRRHAYTHTVGIHSWRERQEQPSDLFFQHVSLAVGQRGHRHSHARVSTATRNSDSGLTTAESVHAGLCQMKDAPNQPRISLRASRAASTRRAMLRPHLSRGTASGRMRPSRGWVQQQQQEAQDSSSRSCSLTVLRGNRPARCPANRLRPRERPGNPETRQTTAMCRRPRQGPAMAMLA